MDNSPLAAANTISSPAARGIYTVTLERAAKVYARFALGAAFLSAVADRFGLWGKYGGWGNFANFTQYTAQVNSFMPAFMIPFLAWAATAAELSVGVCADYRHLAPLDGLWCSNPAVLVRCSYGHFVRNQVPVGLLSIFRFRRSALAGRDTFWTPAHLAIQFGAVLTGLSCAYLIYFAHHVRR
jgi:hypothetical protein